MRYISRVGWSLLVSLLLLATFITPVASAQSLAPTRIKASHATHLSACLQPPQSMKNMLQLSDTSLLSMGLPSKAAISQNPTHWSQVLSHIGQRVCERGHPINLSKDILNRKSSSPNATQPRSLGQGCNATPGSQCQNALWAGNEAVSSDGKGDRGVYRTADFEVTVPAISSSPSGAIAAYWDGVGGNGYVTGSTTLVQAGVYTQVSGSGQSNVSWVEVANNVPFYNLPLCRLHTGDTIESYVESNLNNDGYDYFFLDNYSASCYNSCYVHTNNNGIRDTCGFSGGASFNSDSATGECIVERQGGQTGPPLAHFNPSASSTVQMQGCYINGSGIGNQSHNYLVIENSASQLMAGCGGINTSNNTFPVIWYRSS